MNIEEFEKAIKYKFKNKELLRTALTHTSYAHENRKESNEKLEFLGDSILEFVTSDYLYRNYKKLREGDMTKVRASVVCESSLYEIALANNFGKYLYLGKSEKKTNGSSNISILADSVEAVIAAIYLDSGLEEAKKFIINNLQKQIEISSKSVGMKDYKTVLQEKLQVHGNVKIEYSVIEEKGPDHDKTFIVEVKCESKKLATGKGTTKKSAEMDAAKNALGGMER